MGTSGKLPYTITVNMVCECSSVLITRIFDHRVKCFMKHVVMAYGPGEPRFTFYSYRVEFQARGLPHIHGNNTLILHFYKLWT